MTVVKTECFPSYIEVSRLWSVLVDWLIQTWIRTNLLNTIYFVYCKARKATPFPHNAHIQTSLDGFPTSYSGQTRTQSPKDTNYSAMTAYVVFLLTITDMEIYQRYGEGFMEIFSTYEGQILAATESAISIEGTWPCDRAVIISFPSAGALNRWYDSSEYQIMVKHRHQASTSQAAMIPGLGHDESASEPPQDIA